jgi:hypothetical protein
MLRAARILNLFILVFAGAGAASAAFISSSVAEFVGAVLFSALLLPLWLALFALGRLRPRIEKAALIFNYVFVFLLACGFVAVVTSLGNRRLGFAFLPLIVLLFIASALNVAAINKQRKQRTGTAVETVTAALPTEPSQKRSPVTPRNRTTVVASVAAIVGVGVGGLAVYWWPVKPSDPAIGKAFRIAAIAPVKDPHPGGDIDVQLLVYVPRAAGHIRIKLLDCMFPLGTRFTPPAEPTHYFDKAGKYVVWSGVDWVRVSSAAEDGKYYCEAEADQASPSGR